MYEDELRLCRQASEAWEAGFRVIAAAVNQVLESRGTERRVESAPPLKGDSLRVAHVRLFNAIQGLRPHLANLPPDFDLIPWFAGQSPVGRHGYSPDSELDQVIQVLRSPSLPIQDVAESMVRHAARIRRVLRVGPWLIRRASRAIPNEAYTLRRSGEMWELRFDVEFGTLKDSVGIARLAKLLANVGKELTAGELDGVTHNAIGLDGGESRLPRSDLQALRAARNRLRQIEEDIAATRAAGDLDCLDELLDEQSKLKAYVSANGGLAGSVSTDATPASRAATTAKTSIERTSRAIVRAGMPRAGEHFLKCVERRGASLIYAPASPPNWAL